MRCMVNKAHLAVLDHLVKVGGKHVEREVVCGWIKNQAQAVIAKKAASGAQRGSRAYQLTALCPASRKQRPASNNSQKQRQQQQQLRAASSKQPPTASSGRLHQ